MSQARHQTVETPVGRLRLTAQDGALVRVEWVHGSVEADDDPVLRDAADQIGAYFSGARQTFDLPLSARGTDFQRRVWAALSDIPFGETRTYAEISKAVGSHARATANACGANPIPVVIPCHRVTGSGGSFGGFSGGDGIETKRKLLDLEGHGLPLFS